MIAHTWWMTHRQLKALLRQPGVLVITLIQPMVWLFLFGNLFQRVVELPGFGAGSYLDYLVPGVVVMNAVSSNMWSGMSAIDEIERGTLNRFLTTPVSRAALMNANVIVAALTTALQSAVIVLLGWAAGARYPGGVLGPVALVVLSVLLGTTFSALSHALGMTLRQRESVIGLSVFLLLPLTFLSTAFMAKSLMPGWMQGIAAGNPVDWALVAARGTLAADVDWGAALGRGGLLLGLAAVLVLLSTGTFRGYQKKV
ncbi:ABC transporter [Actinorhabdospora filicis]|uniref:Transport permease protein n=1 Tax=Actinorhabdospora filicis TaxID=1785913 RepID=A0A9W6SKH2_9ACTN|nr:ABC transporter permease [Actinorhabdospora filicis]GLZ77898.1 ABC transporter [Actinorhabdospora filicis]